MQIRARNETLQNEAFIQIYGPLRFVSWLIAHNPINKRDSTRKTDTSSYRELVQTPRKTVYLQFWLQITFLITNDNSELFFSQKKPITYLIAQKSSCRRNSSVLSSKSASD